MTKLSRTTANLMTLTTAQKNNNKKCKTLKPEHRFVLIVASALLLALVLSLFVCRFAFIRGDSMKGTLNDGDMVIVSPTAYLKNDIRRGDIVLLKRDDLTEGHIVKRVIALSGECIEIRSGKVLINGEVLDDCFYLFDESDHLSPVTVPDGCCFVMGDNRAESNDSRHWKMPFVKYEDISGKVIMKLFPNISKPTHSIF